MISERSIYRLIDAGLISAKNIDLPRKVRFRVRKKKKELKVDKKCRIGRTFDLFQKFMEEHPDIPLTQMDTVEGKKGGKVLLTIHFVKAEFMLVLHRHGSFQGDLSGHPHGQRQRILRSFSHRDGCCRLPAHQDLLL